MNRTLIVLVGLLSMTSGAFGWQSAPVAPPPTAAASEDKKLTVEELDQLVAPLALYPDTLLSQVLMASTYPLEIVQADRWVKANASLKGDALAKELEKQPWDPSVKAVAVFPETLSMMSEKLDITTKLGDAFIDQQKDLMDAVQRLRNKAKTAGNLESNQQQTVTVEAAPAGGSTTQTIIIESSSPEVVYVPQYNPTVVYGSWPYPAYPPYPYYPPYPPGYVAGVGLISFGLGVAVGAAWNNNWGHCDWNGGSININNNFNRNTNINNIQGGNRNNINGGGSQWKHNPQHRQGAPYKNSATAQKYGGTSTRQAAQARESYRGRESSQPSAANRSAGAGQSGANRAGNSAGARPSTQPAARPSTPSRSPSAQPSNRSSSGGGLSSGGGSSTRQASSRGSSSRSTGGGSRSGGGSRGGGGGRR